MELWIRSQDKYTLMKIEEIQICENPDGSWFMNAGIVLGKYKSKERALEILDEIQNLLNPMLVFKNCNCTQEMLDNIKEVGACIVSDNTHIEQVQNCIYEMPEE